MKRHTVKPIKTQKMKTLVFTALLVLLISFSATAGPKEEKPKSGQKIAAWVNNNVKYPSDAIENREEGTVYVAFAVVDGEIKEIEVVGSVSETLDTEVLNTIQTIPVSEMGVEKNETKTYILPVKFEIK